MTLSSKVYLLHHIRCTQYAHYSNKKYCRCLTRDGLLTSCSPSKPSDRQNVDDAERKVLLKAQKSQTMTVYK